MSFSTVGELMERLKTFDPSTPVLLSDSGGKYYTNVNLTAGLLFRVVPVGKRNGDDADLYIDADPRHPHSFDAIVL